MVDASLEIWHAMTDFEIFAEFQEIAATALPTPSL
jgi:hypothetical protein